MVYVEFDDLEWDKREWVKVYEDFSTFLVEYHLIWAKRNDPSQTQGSKSRQIQWPALTFKPLVENSIPSSITAVEFLIDKQLDFLTEDCAFQPYQDDIDSLKPVLRDNPQLHAEVKVWVKEQKVQEIFMQGPYSLNGYRVRVYRQDSATQWFTGIITHHDLFTRTMIVMNDQVLEPQNVDPSMVQMTFLDDVVHSLLKGENIGITSRRRSRASHNINAVHGHYTRAQANSPRPAMNSQAAVPKQNTHQQQQQRNVRPNKRKGSDSSIPDEERMKEEKYDYLSRGENPKGKNKHVVSKRRKPEEDEKKLHMKRFRTDNASDVSESSDSEKSSKRISDNSSEQTPEYELKNKITSKEDNHEEGQKPKSVDSHLQEKMTLHSSEQATVADHDPNDSVHQECNMENKHIAELLPKEKLVSRTPTPKCVLDIKNDTHSERVAQENSNTFGLQTLENTEPNVSDSKHSNAKYLETVKQDSDQSWVNDVVKVDLTQSSVTNTSSGSDHRDVDKERNHYVSYMSSLSTVSVTEDHLHKRSPPPETIKSKLTTSLDTQKTKLNSSPEVVKPKITPSPDSVKSKAAYVNSQAVAHPSASYNQLGLYPIIWQYPNGTHAYSGLGLPSSKWVHPENAVNAEASLRRSSPSPWLHQPTPVTSADGIGLLSHIPVRPSSAEPHRPHKITVHSSPPVAKTLVDHHKEELERKAFIEPLRCNAPPLETGERLNKYKEEHRRILQESIDVAPFTTKIKGPEVERENYSRGLSEMWKSNNNLSKEKTEWPVEKSNGKSQAAVASVIVRPPSSTKVDSVPSVPLASKDRVCERSSSGAKVMYSLSNTILASTSLECTTSKSVSQAVAQTKECKVSTTGPVTIACTQYKNSNVSEAELNSVRSQTAAASLPLDSTTICGASNKAISVGNGPAAQTSQPNYHTKLKKAWLTRHSEEDKNTNKMENSGNSVSEIIKPCSVNLIASTSNDIQNSVDNRVTGDKYGRDDKASRRKAKRTYESGSESGDSDESESKSEQRTKRQPKPTYKKKQNDLQKRKGEIEEDLKPNGVLSRSAKEKSKLKLQNSNSAGIPRSVLKDWRKVKKLKQTGESFLQDDSCCEIGPNLQKCRECRLIRSKKGEESAHSPVFCRFYYFRRLSFSKNGVVRIDGFSSPEQYDDEAMSLWTHENYEDDEVDIETSKYILDIIGDKFCQLVTSEKTALSWVKKDAKIAWKRAVRGVREMCDACEATLFNVHWVCRKCGFVACLDCYKAKERKSSRDKELYAWMKCVKGQPHDHKHLMPTQIIPGSVLTDLLDAMHILREKYGIKSHCHCTNKQNIQVGNFPTVNGVSQVIQNVLNHSSKTSRCIPESQQQSTPQKSQSNGSSSPGSVSTDSRLTPPESQSPLHWLADLAEQKAREEKQENKEFALEKEIKEEGEQDASDSPNGSTSPPASQNNEQGSTLRDLLTTTAGKLRVGSTDAGIAFAPVYSMGASSGKSGRSMPNILDDIIASVVENKIPPNKTAKINVKSEPNEEPKESRKSAVNESNKLYSDIPHSWICDQHILWLKDYKNSNNWKLFKECWKQGQPAVVSGVHKKMNISLWKAESISLDFGDHQADLLNCKDSIVSNANVKEFWDGFEEISKRQKNKSGETVVLKLKDCPSGEDFKTMMPARYEDFLRSLPLPEYCNPEGKFNLASHLPGFFVRPDLGPRLCSAYGVAAAKDHDIGTTNLHVEASDVVNILVYVGIAKGNGVLSKAGILKKFEEEELDDILRKRLKDSSEMPGALWHIYAGKDLDKIREFLQKISKEQGLEVLPEHDPIRDQSWYVNRKLRQRLLEEYGVRACTLIQFLGDAIVLPAGTLHQVQNFHSCIQVTEDFVSPEHLVQSFHLTQELRLLKEEINYDDKLQVKNILYHAVKEMVRALKIHEDEVEDMEDT
ncbi:putative JmjC domain-containing histone demethylation protein 2C [Cricetulus griseus]|nr:putative JmjC domain-containing histone demethylation protein 2C [Cricetulus griseus]